MSEGTDIQVDAREAVRLLRELERIKEVKRAEIRKIVREEEEPVRRAVMAAFRSRVKSDPRRAAQGVRKIVYRDGNGGMVNILPGKAARRMAVYRKGDGGRSGIRRTRPVSAETRRMAGYRGKDRGFVLRWVERGTGQRRSRYGNRGQIGARGFFRVADGGMRRASERVGSRLGELVEKAVKQMGR